MLCATPRHTTMFPNIGVLLKIACTLPVTSCECERSASALRRLINYMRASVGKKRLSNLALMHIHYDKDIDLDKVVDCFAQLHPTLLLSSAGPGACGSDRRCLKEGALLLLYTGCPPKKYPMLSMIRISTSSL